MQRLEIGMTTKATSLPLDGVPRLKMNTGVFMTDRTGTNRLDVKSDGVVGQRVTFHVCSMTNKACEQREKSDTSSTIDKHTMTTYSLTFSETRSSVAKTWVNREQYNPKCAASLHPQQRDDPQGQRLIWGWDYGGLVHCLQQNIGKAHSATRWRRIVTIFRGHQARFLVFVVVLLSTSIGFAILVLATKEKVSCGFHVKSNGSFRYF